MIFRKNDFYQEKSIQMKYVTIDVYNPRREFVRSYRMPREEALKKLDRGQFYLYETEYPDYVEKSGDYD